VFSPKDGKSSFDLNSKENDALYGLFNKEFHLGWSRKANVMDF
jgi:hypothetical protein